MPPRDSPRSLKKCRPRWHAQRDQQFPRVDVTTDPPGGRWAGGRAGGVGGIDAGPTVVAAPRLGASRSVIRSAVAVVLLVAARGLGRARDEQRRSTAIMLVWAALLAAGAAAALAVPGPPGGWHLIAAISTVLAGTVGRGHTHQPLRRGAGCASLVVGLSGSVQWQRCTPVGGR